MDNILDPSCRRGRTWLASASWIRFGCEALGLRRNFFFFLFSFLKRIWIGRNVHSLTIIMLVVIVDTDFLSLRCMRKLLSLPSISNYKFF